MDNYCSHREYGDSEHCAVMECPNYINKCPVHGIIIGIGVCTHNRMDGEADR